MKATYIPVNPAPREIQLTMTEAEAQDYLNRVGPATGPMAAPAGPTTENNQPSRLLSRQAGGASPGSCGLGKVAGWACMRSPGLVVVLRLILQGSTRGAHRASRHKIV